MYTAEIMSRDQYVPKNPNKSDLDNVFDLSFPTVQPYLFKVSSFLFWELFFFFSVDICLGARIRRCSKESVEILYVYSVNTSLADVNHIFVAIQSAAFRPVDFVVYIC